MKKFIIQDREAGNYITWESTREEAEKRLAEYEEQDRADGTFTENFYEIVEKNIKTYDETECKFSGDRFFVRVTAQFSHLDGDGEPVYKDHRGNYAILRKPNWHKFHFASEDDFHEALN